MSAETLRKAAALMRERAEKAAQADERWMVDDSDWGLVIGSYVPDDRDQGTGWISTSCVAYFAYPDQPDGEHKSYAGAHSVAAHMASWHPAVALAVADWLERAAQSEDAVVQAKWSITHMTGYNEALAVARAYLGEPT